MIDSWLTTPAHPRHLDLDLLNLRHLLNLLNLLLPFCVVPGTIV